MVGSAFFNETCLLLLLLLLLLFYLFVAVVVVVFLFVVVVVVVVVVFTVAVQVTLFLTRRTSSPLIFNIQTLSLSSASLCLSENLRPEQQLALQYVPPTSFFAVLAVVSLLGRLFIAIRVWIARQAAVPALWALLTFSYAFLCYPTFFFLFCYKFNGEYIFYLDASMTCFGNRHLPYALLALAVLFGIIIPLPAILLFAREWPRVKPLVDVFLSFLRPKRSWWMAFDVIRRLLLIILATYIESAITRAVVLAGVIQLLLFLHFIVQPYKQTEDNIFEALLLGNSCLYATLNVVPDKHMSELALIIVFSWPTIAAVLFGGFKDRHRLAKFLRKAAAFFREKWRRKSYAFQSSDKDQGQELATQKRPSRDGEKNSMPRTGREQFRLREPLLYDGMRESIDQELDVSPNSGQ